MYDLHVADETIRVGLEKGLLPPDTALPLLERLYQGRTPKAYAGLKGLLRQYAHDLSLPTSTLDDVIKEANNFELPKVMMDELMRLRDGVVRERDALIGRVIKSPQASDIDPIPAGDLPGVIPLTPMFEENAIDYPNTEEGLDRAIKKAIDTSNRYKVSVSFNWNGVEIDVNRHIEDSSNPRVVKMSYMIRRFKLGHS